MCRPRVDGSLVGWQEPNQTIDTILGCETSINVPINEQAVVCSENDWLDNRPSLSNEVIGGLPGTLPGIGSLSDILNLSLIKDVFGSTEKTYKHLDKERQIRISSLVLQLSHELTHGSRPEVQSVCGRYSTHVATTAEVKKTSKKRLIKAKDAAMRKSCIITETGNRSNCH